MGNIEGREVVVLPGDFRAQLEPQLIRDLQIDLDNCGIELRSRAADNLFARRVEGPRDAIGPVAGDGVKRIGNGEDSRPDGNGGIPQPAGVAASVVVFLVRVHDFCGLSEEWNLAQHLVAARAVLAHERGGKHHAQSP